MKKLKKSKIMYAVILVGMFCLGMLFQSFLLNSKADAELEKLNKEIELTKENNRELEKEIVNLRKEIEKKEENESQGTDLDDSNVTSSNQTSTSDLTNIVEEQTGSTNTAEEQTNTSDSTNTSSKDTNLSGSTNTSNGDSNASGSTNTSNDDSNASDSASTTNEDSNASDSTSTSSEETTQDYSSTQAQAINLVKDYIGYSNESNVHFEIQGNVSGTEDLSIQVYEVVVDEGESQHTATWGWYGVNIKTGKVYEVTE